MSPIRILKNLFIISIFFTACKKNDKPEPVIAHLTSFTPQHAVAGTTIIITGQGFSANPADNKITINGVAVTATQASDTSLSVIVPQKVGSGPISVTVNNQTTISSTNFIYDKAYWVTTVAGSSQGYLDGNASTAQFYNPIGVVEDANGNIYVSDSHSNRIRKIDALGNVTT